MSRGAQFIKVVYKDIPVVGSVLSHAARIFVDHLAHLGNLIPDIHQLVHLFLVVAKNCRYVHIIDQLGNFIGQGGLIDPGRDGTKGLGTDGHKQQFRNIVADQCHLVAL